MIKYGGNAIGMTGKDANLILAKKLYMQKLNDDGSTQEVDLGFVGEVESR
nr:hypothetical protein [Moraxella catarrhalis]